jgi:hypothetical protein
VSAAAQLADLQGKIKRVDGGSREGSTDALNKCWWVGKVCEWFMQMKKHVCRSSGVSHLQLVPLSWVLGMSGV